MRRTSVGLFLISLTALLVELLLTRIFDVILSANLAFLIISCAIFGLGLGGLFDTLVPRTSVANPDASLGPAALLFAISVWALPPLLNAIPFSPDRIGREPITQLASFLLLYLVLLAPFFFAGLCVCRIFSGAARYIQRLYFWDLSGAAVGTAILIPVLPALGPARLLVAAALAGLGAAALFGRRRFRLMLVGVAGAFVLVPAVLGGRYLTLALHSNKRDALEAIAEGRLEYERWDPVAEIAVLDTPARTKSPFDRGRKHIAYDGGAMSSDFFPFDGDFAALRRDLPDRLAFQFWRRGVLASHYLRRDTGYSTLIIGSAGGQETKAALLYGAAHVDAVEMVGTVVRLATGRYASYIGHLFERPGVTVHIDEGRSFLRASQNQYDIIQIFSNYTPASIESGSGAISADYLQTEDAYEEFYRHLKADGIVHVNHIGYPRMIATAAAAWRALGRENFRAHVLVFEAQGRDPDYLPTVLIKMTPWSPAEVADAQRFFAFPAVHEAKYALVENPLDPGHSFLPDVFYSGSMPPSFLAAAPYDASVVTDDRPFFRFMRRSIRRLAPARWAGLNYSTADMLNVELRGGWVPMDWLHLIVALAAGVFYGFVFVLVPMLVSRVGRQPWTGKQPTLVYFSLLGLGFIGIELVFIQVFMKLIGYPLYAVTVVIAVMLFGAALGSMTSRRIVGSDRSRWHVAFAGVLVTGWLIRLSFAPVSAYFMAAPIAVRILVAAAMIFPIAFFMGMPFPLGILELEAKPRGAVAWAWSMNGLFTTIGGVAAAVSSLMFGFRATELAALTMYALAWVAYARLRRSNRLALEPRAAVEPVPQPLARRVRIAALWASRS